MSDASWDFHLQSSEDLIVLNGVVLPLGQVYLDKLKTEPNTKIAYHNIVERSAESPTTFTLNQTRNIAFTVAGDTHTDAPKAANMFATQVPLWAWIAQLTEVLWQVKWTPKGLTPIKPAMYSLMEVEFVVGQPVPSFSHEVWGWPCKG